MSLRLLVGMVVSMVLLPTASVAQEPIPYGARSRSNGPRTLIAVAEGEAAKQKWPVAIAVVDSSGHLVAFAKMDSTQLGSIEVALGKSKCVALFRRPTKVFEEALAKGGENLRVLKVPGVIPVEGGLPIILDGKVIGAIGVSGAKASEDGQEAQAAIDSLKPKP